MITEWIIAVGCNIGAWFSTLFDAFKLPASWADGLRSISNVTSGFDGMAVWVNFAVLAGVIVVVVAVYGVGFGIKGLRVVASHIPFVGGSGA